VRYALGTPLRPLVVTNIYNDSVYYVIMRSKNEVICAAAGCAAKAHKTIFAPNNIRKLFLLFKTC
jgi:hypothetical protein